MFLACYYHIIYFIWHHFMQVGGGKAGAEENFTQKPCPQVPAFSALLIINRAVWRPAMILEKEGHHQSFQTSERRQNTSVRTPASALQGRAAPEQPVLALSRGRFYRERGTQTSPAFLCCQKETKKYVVRGREERTDKPGVYETFARGS